MSLKQQIFSDMTAAMKARDADTPASRPERGRADDFSDDWA